MKQQIQDYSYYHNKLMEHVESSFPERSKDSKFIEQRARWAANVAFDLEKEGRKASAEKVFRIWWAEIYIESNHFQ